MSYLRTLLVIAFFGASSALAGVGYRVLDLSEPGKENGRAVTVAVWYPTAVEGMHRADLVP